MRNLDSCRCWRCTLCTCKVRNKFLVNFWNRTILLCIPCICLLVWEVKVHYLAHKSQPLAFNLNHINVVPIPTSCFFNIHCNLIFPSKLTFSNWYPSSCPSKILYLFLSSSCEPHIRKESKRQRQRERKESLQQEEETKFSRCWGRRTGSNKMMKPEHFWVQWGVVFYFISLLLPPSHPLPLIDGERASGWIWDVVGTRFRDGNWIWIGRSIDFKTNADAVPVSTLPFTPCWDIVTVNYMVDNSTSNKVLHTVQPTLDIRPFVMDCPSTSPHVLFRTWRDKKTFVLICFL